MRPVTNRPPAGNTLEPDAGGGPPEPADVANLAATRRRWPGVLRWSLAAMAVSLAHLGAAWIVLNWNSAHAEAAAGAPEPAMMIELSAVSVAPEAPPEALPPAAEPVAPETPPEPVKETPPPEPPPPPAPEPVVEPPVTPAPPDPEPMPVQAPEPEIKLPELPSIPNADAVLTPPPKPIPAPVPVPDRPRAVEKPVERKPPPKPRVAERRPERPRATRAAAPPPAPLRSAAPSAASQGAAAEPSVSPASWRGSLIAHLNRYKRFPGGAQPGTAQVAFSIDRSGRVLSARLAGSSGDSALDEEAVAMIRRASPVPAPPSGLGGGTIALAVPIRFTR